MEKISLKGCGIKTVFIIIFIGLISACLAENSNISKLAKQIKEATGDNKRILMNRLKKQLRYANKQQREHVIRSIKTGYNRNKHKNNFKKHNSSSHNMTNLNKYQHKINHTNSNTNKNRPNHINYQQHNKTKAKN